MRKKIKYIGFYDETNSKHKRNGSLSAINKMNYIVEVIVKLGMDVDIISPSYYIDSNAPTTSEETIYINENVSLVKAPSFATKNKFTTRFKYHFSQIWLFIYLIKNTKKK